MPGLKMDRGDHGPGSKKKAQISKWIFKKSGELPINWDSGIIDAVKNFFRRLIR